MPWRVAFARNSEGLAEFMQSEGVEEEIASLAEAIGLTADATFTMQAGKEAEDSTVVEEYDFVPTAQAGPRIAYSVTVRDVRAAGTEAKHGFLSAAARAQGLEIVSLVSDE